MKNQILTILFLISVLSLQCYNCKMNSESSSCDNNRSIDNSRSSLFDDIVEGFATKLEESATWTLKNVLNTSNALAYQHPIGKLLPRQFRARIVNLLSDDDVLLDDCLCQAKVVQDNYRSLYTSLEGLVSQTYFKYFRVNYLQECPFWAEEYLCSTEGPGDCGICECPDDQVPAFLHSDTLEHHTEESFHGFEDHSSSQWIEQEQQKEATFIDLQLNPERYTGYGKNGGTARQIWSLIYEENCFSLSAFEDQCFEERVFYRLVSGLHASTTAHICELFGDEQLPNLPMFVWRLGAFPDRVSNVYFSFIFLLRAIDKLESSFVNAIRSASSLDTPLENPALQDIFGANGLRLGDDDQPLSITSSHSDSKQALGYLKEIYANQLLDGCLGPLFDERNMFASEHTVHLKDQFRLKFRNISRLMDCVSCETCKIHAKLQILGIGTALKVLLSDETNQQQVISSLQRNEIIALFNTVFKFAETIDIIERMRQREKQLIITNYAKVVLFIAFLLTLLHIFVKTLTSMKTTKKLPKT